MKKRKVEMGMLQKVPLRLLALQEQEKMQRIIRATSERVDVVKRAKALQAVAQGCSFTEAGRRSSLSREGVSQLVERFNKLGLAVLAIAKGRGRKPTYDGQMRARVVQEVRRQPDRENDQTATWSLKLLERSLRRGGLPSIGATTIGRILHEEGYSFQRDRTWCDTGTALRVRKDGVYCVHDPQAHKKKEFIELAYRVAEACGLPLWCQDEAGPYATRPQPGASWQLQGKASLQPHEYLRDGGAKLMTLFRPATGELRAKGVTSVTNAVLHPWLQEQLLSVLGSEEEGHRQQVEQIMTGNKTEEAAQYHQWETWLGWRLSDRYPPPRMILVWDNLAGHHSDKMVRWLFEHGIMPLYTPLSGSWLNMAESVQRIIVRRALSGQYPQTQTQIIEWLEQTVVGWNQDPTPFVWNGKRRERRRRAKLKRLAGSGAAILAYAS
jgi:transposase